jgi:hypothetical protein
VLTSKPSKKPVWSRQQAFAVMLGLFFNYEYGVNVILWTLVDFERILGVISQKIEILVTITVRISYPTHKQLISFLIFL